MSNPKSPLDDFSSNKPGKGSRRKLLPVWIKIFLWIFLVIGVLIPFDLLTLLLFPKMETGMALYGLESSSIIDFTGLTVLFLFALKAVTAYGMWVEKDWAIKAGITDAILGIVICTFVMVIVLLQSKNGLSFPFEIIILIIYLIRLLRLKPEWDKLKTI